MQKSLDEQENNHGNISHKRGAHEIDTPLEPEVPTAIAEGFEEELADMSIPQPGQPIHEPDDQIAGESITPFERHLRSLSAQDDPGQGRVLCPRGTTRERLQLAGGPVAFLVVRGTSRISVS